MDLERIKEIQAETAYPDSISVQQALLKVWRECSVEESNASTSTEIPMFIQRCLTYGVRIWPHQLSTILEMYKKYKVPDEVMIEFNREKTEAYIEGLYFSGQEMSNDWTKGYDLLESIGFTETTREEGHRSFTSLSYLS